MDGIKKVFKLKVAVALFQRGHGVFDTEVNRKDKKLKVFLFIATPKLEEDFKEIQLILEKEKNEKAI